MKYKFEFEINFKRNQKKVYSKHTGYNQFPTVNLQLDRGTMAMHLLNIPLSQWFPNGFLGLAALGGMHMTNYWPVFSCFSVEGQMTPFNRKLLFTLTRHMSFVVAMHSQLHVYFTAYIESRPAKGDQCSSDPKCSSNIYPENLTFN